jgi:hypothetical protein
MMKDPSNCIFKKILKWKLVTGGKQSGAFATTHKRCEECEEKALETCLKETFKDQTKKTESDYSQMNIYINLKPKTEIEQTSTQEQENEQEEEAPAF